MRQSDLLSSEGRIYSIYSYLGIANKENNASVHTRWRTALVPNIETIKKHDYRSGTAGYYEPVQVWIVSFFFGHSSVNYTSISWSFVPVIHFLLHEKHEWLFGAFSAVHINEGHMNG